MLRFVSDVFLSQIAENPQALVRFAEILLASGHKERAWAVCQRAITLSPDDGKVQAIARSILSQEVPGYHFLMVRDAQRHKVCEEALRRTIRPDFRVLDIGSGTGLFAMMAARAGAREVVTCEANPIIAAVVEEIVAKNELEGRVRVVPKHSSDLAIGVDLDAPADVLLFDNVSSSLIADGVLSSVEHAMGCLMRDGATAIPATGTVRIALAEDRDEFRWRMHNVEGFDLSPFNKLASPSYQLRNSCPDLILRSKPSDLFRFDFQTAEALQEADAERSIVAIGGRVTGIAQWLRFNFDTSAQYENAPANAATSAFAVMFYPLVQPIEMEPGEELKVCGHHGRSRLHIWACTA